MTRRAALLALFLLGSATPALADTASERLVRDFVAWVDSSPVWSATVSDVRSQGNDTIADGLVLSRADPEVSVSVETLRLAAMAARPGGGFVAESVELGNVAIVTPQLQYAMPTLAADAVSSPSFGGLSFDPRHMMTFFAQAYSAMAQLEFRNFSIPEMTGLSEIATVSPKGDSAVVSTRIVYRNMTIDAMQDGVMSASNAGPMMFYVSGPEGESQFTVASAASGSIDVGAFAHVFDPANYQNGRGDMVWRPIMSNITYSGVSGSGPKGVTFSLESAAAENFDGRQLDEPFTETFDRLMDIASLDEESAAELGLEMLRTYRAWRLGGFDMHSLRFEAPAEQATFTIDDLTVTGMSSEGVDSFIMNGLRGEGPEGFAALESLELGGFVAPDLEAFIQFAALEDDVDPAMHADIIRKTFQALPRLDHFGLTNAAGGKSEADSVTLDSFTIDFRDWNDIFAGSTEMHLTGLEIPRRLMELEGETAAMWDALGYEDISVGMSVSDRWSPEAGADEAIWTFAMRDAGELELSYTLLGVTEEWMIESTAAAARRENSQAALMAMLDDLSLESARLTVTDRSLLDRSFGVAAQKQGLTASGPAYREQMRAALPFILSAALPPKIVKLLTAPLQEFLAGGRSLVAEIGPPTPLTLANLLAAAEDVMALPERLNLTLRTEATE
jgi:hypothetical protein